MEAGVEAGVKAGVKLASSKYTISRKKLGNQYGIVEEESRNAARGACIILIEVDLQETPNPTHETIVFIGH